MNYSIASSPMASSVGGAFAAVPLFSFMGATSTTAKYCGRFHFVIALESEPSCVR